MISADKFFLLSLSFWEEKNKNSKSYKKKWITVGPTCTCILILYIVQIVEFSISGNAITFLAFMNKFSLTRVVIIKFNCY